MNCILRKWQLSDAKDLAAALDSEKILNNLRDGLPFPYTGQDASEYIAPCFPQMKTMLSPMPSPSVIGLSAALRYPL